MGKGKYVYPDKEQNLDAEGEGGGEFDLIFAGDLRKGLVLGKLMHYTCKVNIQLRSHK